MRSCFALIPALAAVACVAVAADEGSTVKAFRRHDRPTIRKAPFEIGTPMDAAFHVAARSVTGTVTGKEDSTSGLYVYPATIGTPGQTIMMAFDLTTTDFWVFSSELPAGGRSGHAVYTPGSSSTSTLDKGETWDTNDASGSEAGGNVYFDKVVIGGVTATSQGIECATSVASSLESDTSYDGENGFGFGSESATPTALKSWFSNVAPSLPTPIFAVQVTNTSGAIFDFGVINTSRYTGSITYASVNSANGYWEFTATGYSVGSTTYSASIDSIVDTDTTLVYLPTAVVDNYYAAVAGAQNSQSAGGWIFPCSAKLPSLGILSGGAYHTVAGSLLNYATYSGSQCYGGLQSSSSVGLNILGEIFLLAQYAVFDTSVPRIGFATNAK